MQKGQFRQGLPWRTVVVVVTVCTLAQHAGNAQSPTSGLQDPAWAPDGRHIAVSYLDRIWVMTPEAGSRRCSTPAAGRR